MLNSKDECTHNHGIEVEDRPRRSEGGGHTRVEVRSSRGEGGDGICRGGKSGGGVGEDRRLVQIAEIKERGNNIWAMNIFVILFVREGGG